MKGSKNLNSTFCIFIYVFFFHSENNNQIFVTAIVPQQTSNATWKELSIEMYSTEEQQNALTEYDEGNMDFKNLLKTFSDYTTQKKDNDVIIDELEAMMQNLAEIYNIDYKDMFLEGSDGNTKRECDAIELKAKDYIKVSNENYNLLRDIQFQLKIRDKLVFLINDFNEILDYLQNHIQGNLKHLTYKSQNQNSILEKVTADVESLKQIRSREGELNFKKVYLKISKDIEDMIGALQ